MLISDMELLLDFKSGSDAELISTTQIILVRTKGKERYAAIAANVEKVELAYNNFIVAVSNAINSVPEQKTERDKSRIMLEVELEALGNACIQNSNGDPTYVTDANFKLRSDKPKQSRAPFSKPEWDYLVRGIKSGTAKGSVKSLPKGAVGVLPQWRISGDTGAFTIGNPSAGIRFLLEDLPPMAKVDVQVRYYGTWNRQSDWSQPLPIEII